MPHRLPCRHLGPVKTNAAGVVITEKCYCGVPPGEDPKNFDISYPVHDCALHRRCIPSLQLGSKSRVRMWEERKPESDLNMACALCQQRGEGYEPVPASDRLPENYASTFGPDGPPPPPPLIFDHHGNLVTDPDFEG